MNNPLFTLLQVAIGQKTSMEQNLDKKVWLQIFKQAKQQALLGVTYGAIENLPKEERPPFTLLAQWFTMTQKIEQSNAHLNTWCEKVEANFLQEGFSTCILKGQGIAQLYPQPMRRQCGDIDVWVVPNESLDEKGGIKESLNIRRKKIVSYVQRFLPNEKPVYHHIDFNTSKEVTIEVHFTPSWLNDPFDNYHLQSWFELHTSEIFSKAIVPYTTPTTAFNMVYVLLHIYRHIFSEGIGLRQVMDYYYVVKDFNQQATPTEKEQLIHDLKNLHLYPFAQAVMWVLGKVFVLSKEEMLCTPDAKKGASLLQEIMLAGNFGKYDERINTIYSDGSWRAFVTRTQRNIRFLKHYPREVIWSPFFKLWHQAWLRLNGWK